MGWGGALDTILSWFSPEQRVRRIRDEIDKLKKERKKLFQGEATEKTYIRVLRIDERLSKLDRLLQNCAR